MSQAKLNGVLKYELDRSKLQISSYCVKQLEYLVSNGIKRMTMSNVIDHAGYVMQAERNLKSLIEYFDREAVKAGTFPELSDSHFDAALRTCPTLWPFATSG